MNLGGGGGTQGGSIEGGSRGTHNFRVHRPVRFGEQWRGAKRGNEPVMAAASAAEVLETLNPSP